MKTYAEYQQLVESALTAQLASLGNIPELLYDAMAYSLSAGGKRNMVHTGKGDGKQFHLLPAGEYRFCDWLVCEADDIRIFSAFD